jgi:hypothetical protein
MVNVQTENNVGSDTLGDIQSTELSNNHRKRGRRNAIKPGSQESDVLREFAVTYHLGSFQINNEDLVEPLNVVEEKQTESIRIVNTGHSSQSGILRPSEIIAAALRDGQEEKKAEGFSSADSDCDDNDEEYSSLIKKARVEDEDEESGEILDDELAVKVGDGDRMERDQSTITCDSIDVESVKVNIML